ncbi:hypothetical protein PMI29_03948 [Pseudomonas sp. GM49]|nr:hypothetical protein PMI29_03948 [Pseudomonas sp. GM49]
MVSWTFPTGCFLWLQSTLIDENELEIGILTNRRKGCRDNIVRWTPRLRKAWDNAKAYRAKVWTNRKTPVPIAPSRRNIIVASHGGPLRKSSLDTAWHASLLLLQPMRSLHPSSGLPFTI